MPAWDLTKAEQELRQLMGERYAPIDPPSSEDLTEASEVLSDGIQEPGKPIPGKLYVMVGLPGSGKTTYIREHLQDAARVCHDDLYRMISSSYRPTWRPLYHMAEDAIIINALASGWDVVVDRTCLDKLTRQRFVRLAHDVNAFVFAVVMTTPANLAREMNMNAERREAGHCVSDEVFDQLLGKYEQVEAGEGFANIKYVNPFEESVSNA